MSKMIDSLHEICNSPFLLANCFVFAYRNLPIKSNNVLLAYLVLPLILYPRSSNFLQHANIRSSILTLRNKKEQIAGLSERISYYRNLTNLCLQYLIDNNILFVDNDMSVHINNQIDLPTARTQEELAASKLYLIFRDIPIQTIYRQLGVRSL